MNSYNNYSPEQRNKKLRTLNKLLKQGVIPKAHGKCMLCNDPDSLVEYHDEDYSEPFKWEPPAMFTLCRHCHRYKLHKRFNNPNMWKAFIAHVRRGGYASDLKDKSIKKEVVYYQKQLANNEIPKSLKKLRTYQNTVGAEWFSQLTE